MIQETRPELALLDIVMPVMDAIRIRTGESGDAAIDEV